MTYVITGELLREEKPEKFLNKFIDFDIIKIATNDQSNYHASYRHIITTSSKKQEEKLTQKGYNLVWNNDPDLADLLTREYEVNFFKTIFSIPENGWENYLNENHIQDEENLTKSGEIFLWDEYRFPSKFAYCYASGKLENKFILDSNNGFIIDPENIVNGERKTKGLVIDTPSLTIRYAKFNFEKRSRNKKEAEEYEKQMRFTTLK